MKEARLICPVRDNNGLGLWQLHGLLEDKLVEAFGGATHTLSRGLWKDGSGKLYNKQVILYDIAAEDRAESVRKLVGIARWLCKAARQHSVYVRLFDGRVLLVEKE